MSSCIAFWAPFLTQNLTEEKKNMRNKLNWPAKRLEWVSVPEAWWSRRMVCRPGVHLCSWQRTWEYPRQSSRQQHDSSHSCYIICTSKNRKTGLLPRFPDSVSLQDAKYSARLVTMEISKTMALCSKNSLHTKRGATSCTNSPRKCFDKHHHIWYIQTMSRHFKNISQWFAKRTQPPR